MACRLPVLDVLLSEGLIPTSPTAPLLAFNSSRYEGTRVVPTLHLWNVETGQLLFEKTIRSFCVGLEFSPDGSTLLACLINRDQGSTNGGLRLLRVPQGDLVWDCPTSISNPNWGVAVDPGFRTAAVGGDRLQVIDLSTGNVLWSATNEYFRGAAFTSDGMGLLTAEGWPSVLQLREVNSGKLIGPPVPLPGAEMGGLTLLPDGKTLLSNNRDGSTQFFDVSDPAQPRALGRPLRGQVGEIAAHGLSRRGETLLTGSWGGSVYAWDTTPPPPDRPLIVLTGVFAWQFAPDNRSILTVDPQGHVERREGPDFQLKRPLLDTGTSLVSVGDRAEFSDDGRWLASSQGGTQDSEVRIWDLQTASLAPRVIPGMLAAHSFAARSGLLMVFAPESDSAQEWDLLTGQKVSSWSSLLPRRPTPLLALSAGGKYRLNATLFGTEASLFEAGATQGRTWTNLGIAGISDANFAPDGRLFVVASMEGSAEVVESGSGRVVTTVGRGQFPIESVGFSADGSRVVTATEKGAALTLWDMSGHELLALPVAAASVDPFPLFDSPRFSADGRLLGWRSSQNELYLWRAPSWAEIEAAESTRAYPQ